MTAAEFADDPRRLVDAALDSPADVLVAARTALDAAPTRVERVLLLQALGIALRESGDRTGALQALARSARLATATPDEPDVRATYAGTLVWAGRRAQGLAQFRRAREAARGATKARVDVRYGLVLGWAEDVDDAARILRHAARKLDRAGDTLWAARAWVNLGGTLAYGGQLNAADVALAEAAQRYGLLGLTTEEARLYHLRGYERWRAGALPDAIALLEVAAERYEAAPGPAPLSLDADRARVLLSAGLLKEATDVVDVALERPGAGEAASLESLLVVAARAALAAGAAGDARRYADRARRLQRRTGHLDFAREAALVGLQARWTSGERSRALTRDARVLAGLISAHRAADRADAALLAGRASVAQHEPETARAWFEAAGRAARRLGPADRVQVSLARGLLAELDGDRAGLRRAARHGLAVLDAYRAALGSPELQARATAYGAELSALAVRDSVRWGSASDLLSCTEQWRATVMQVPPTRPPDDPEQAADVAALRDACRQLDDLAAAGTTSAEGEQLRRSVARLERRIHTRTLTRAAGARPPSATTAQTALRAELGAAGAVLVSLIRVDGRCHVVVADGRRTHRVASGTQAQIDRLVAQLQFLLRAAASGGTAVAAGLSPAVDAAAEALQREALGPAVRLLGDGPLVLAPPARLHAAPWAVLPALAGRPFHVAASARTWLRARAVVPPADGGVALVAGPGLPGADAEVDRLAAGWPGAVALRGADATSAATLQALDGAAMVHLAAHGTFRGDNPLFSAFALSDGPLWLHDLEGLAQPPYRMVLSSCDSAVVAPAGNDELLGVTAVLARAGTAGVVAGVVPVNDAATATLSIRLHQAVRSGQDLAEALACARAAAADDPLARLTAAAFLALGAA